MIDFWIEMNKWILNWASAMNDLVIQKSIETPFETKSSFKLIQGYVIAYRHINRRARWRRSTLGMKHKKWNICQQSLRWQPNSTEMFLYIFLVIRSRFLHFPVMIDPLTTISILFSYFSPHTYDMFVFQTKERRYLFSCE